MRVHVLQYTSRLLTADRNYCHSELAYNESVYCLVGVIVYIISIFIDWILLSTLFYIMKINLHTLFTE